MDMTELREQIDEIDNQIIELFRKRMEIVGDVAEYKKNNNMPVFHRGREREIINRVTKLAPSEMQVYTKTLYNTLFTKSRKIKLFLRKKY